MEQQTQLERGRADAGVARVVVSGHIKGATAIWHSVAGSAGTRGVREEASKGRGTALICGLRLLCLLWLPAERGSY